MRYGGEFGWYKNPKCCFGGGSSGSQSTKYTMPAQIQKLYDTVYPATQMAAVDALAGAPLYPTVQMAQWDKSAVPSAQNIPPSMYKIPEMYNIPSTSNIYNNDLYQTPDASNIYNNNMYQTPDIKSMMPNQGWWSGLDSGVKAGIMEPYNEGSDALSARLNQYGQLGSARGGVSGEGAAGLSNYWAKAMPAAQQTGWGMVAPALQAGWGAELQKNITGYQDTGKENLLDYQTQLQKNITGYQDTAKENMLGWESLLDRNKVDWQSNLARNVTGYNAQSQANLLDYQTELARQQTNLGLENQSRTLQQQSLAAPWTTLPSFTGTTGNLPIVGSQSGTNWGGVASGAASGGLSGLMASSIVPSLSGYGLPLGLGGALFGGLGGK